MIIIKSSVQWGIRETVIPIKSNTQCGFNRNFTCKRFICTRTYLHYEKIACPVSRYERIFSCQKQIPSVAIILFCFLRFTCVYRLFFNKVQI